MCQASCLTGASLAGDEISLSSSGAAISSYIWRLDERLGTETQLMRSGFQARTASPLTNDLEVRISGNVKGSEGPAPEAAGQTEAPLGASRRREGLGMSTAVGACTEYRREPMLDAF